MKISKRILSLATVAALLIYSCAFAAGCRPGAGSGAQFTDAAVKKEAKASFTYLWECVQTDKGSDGYGLVWDKSNGSEMASTASTGFALAALPVAVENKWITSSEGKERALGTLKTLQAISRISGQYYSGFFYHFINTDTGLRYGNSEVSIIDTGLLIAGALTAGEYFKGEIKEIAGKLYAAVDWNFYLDKNKDMFYMGFMPGSGFSGHWDVYAEQLLLYFLAAGAPNAEYRIGASTYYKFTRMKGSYGGCGEYIYSWFNSLFTYQFSHIFIDFEKMTDADGVNWFNNSVIAARTHYQYTVDNAGACKTYSDKSWGFTASEGPNGYNAEFYVPPAADRPTGTIAPSGAVASMLFTPAESLKALKHYQGIKQLNDDRLGLLDAYDLDKDWYCAFAVGLNKGNTLLMLANTLDNFVQKYFMSNTYIQNAINALNFTSA